MRKRKEYICPVCMCVRMKITENPIDGVVSARVIGASLVGWST